MSTRADRVAAVFEAAVLRDAAERSAFVREACADDFELCRVVESMLPAIDDPLLIDRPIDESVAELLNDNQAAVIGSEMGPYRVESLLGVGGMGEVYRASDTVLGRQVAIKVLPAHVASDPERLARFRREAKILASLNHPNVGAIYGVETLGQGTDATLGLVLELVEGPTLAERLMKGPLQVNEALEVARQIAEALDTAHQQGIVHRDLKPGNIKVRDDGTVKVLDFGLAKLADVGPSTSAREFNPHTPAAFTAPSPSIAPTITTPAMTAAGVILGTAAYMAPEQAKGKPADKRADIWAYGVVLYEMLSGRRAFAGDDVAETLAAVLKDDPDWAALPAQVRPLLRRCLEKDPRRRLRDIGDAFALLDTTTDVGTSVPARSPRLAWAFGAVATVVALGLAAFVATRPPSPDPERRTMRLALPGPAGWEFLFQEANVLSGVASPLAVSPDGRYVAVLARPAGGEVIVLVHNLETGIAQPLAGTAGASSIFWSPDSRFVAFASGGVLKRIPVEGGPVRAICEVMGPMIGGTWGADGTIVFSAFQLSGLKQVPAEGGVPRDAALVASGAREIQAMPWFLPDGRHLLYTAQPLTSVGTDVPLSLYVQELGSPDRVKLLDVAARNVQYADGQLLFVLDGTLMAQPFDPVRRTVAGEAVPVATSVQQLGRGVRQDGAFSASQTGVLLYQSGTSGGNRSRLALIDRSGKTLAVGGDGGEPAVYREMSLAPGARQAAAVTGDAIWTIDLMRGVRTRLTTDSGSYTGLAWSPDGSRIAYSATTAAGRSMFLTAINSPGREERLLSSDDAFRIPSSWSRDGRFLLFVQGQGPFSNNDVWVLPRSEGSKAYPLLSTSFNETRPKFSPDGRWIAYASNETGRIEVYVMPFVEPGAADRLAGPQATASRVRVSATGGSSPRWRVDGQELFYLVPESNAVMAASVDGRSGEFIVGETRTLFTLSMAENANASPYDVAADGQRFLVALPDNPSISSPPPTIVLNWAAGLRK